ncbi:hypothetical protein D3C71_1938290 [compost metagenome]
MHAYHGSPVLCRQERRRNAGWHALAHLAPRDLAQRAFARPARQQRIPGRRQHRLLLQQGEVLLHGFAKPGASIPHNAVLLHTQCA